MGIYYGEVPECNRLSQEQSDWSKVAVQYIAEGWLSGLRRGPGKTVGVIPRGFESRPFRHVLERIIFFLERMCAGNRTEGSNPSLSAGLWYNRNMVRYQHTQVGYAAIGIIGTALILSGWYLLAHEWTALHLLVGIVMIVVLIIFSRMTVTVTQEDLTVTLGGNVFCKRILMRKIREVRSVRNYPGYGLGIRAYHGQLPRHYRDEYREQGGLQRTGNAKKSMHKGWLYNVSGLLAVEVELLSGATFRIGTDEPDKLVEAIQEIIGELDHTMR